MDFKNNLIYILRELKLHHRNPSELLGKYVEERLDKSLCTYYDALLENAAYLERKNPLKVMKQISKKISER